MTIEEYKAKVITDYTSKAWALLERIVKNLGERGIEPYMINYMSMTEKSKFFTTGDRVISVNTVYRSNGTERDVTAKIGVYEITGRHSLKRIIEEKVPKDASDNVINRRIDKVLLNF